MRTLHVFTIVCNCNLGSFSFDVGRFVLGNVKDGRIVFRIPNDVADTLDDMLSLPPEFNPGMTRQIISPDIFALHFHLRHR